MDRLIIADIHSNNNRGICTGHYIPVVRMYFDLFENIKEVIAASGPIYLKHFDTSRMLLLPYDMIAGKNYIINRIKALINAKYLFENAKQDTIILQDGRPITNHIGIALFHHKKNKLFLIKYSVSGKTNFIGKLLWSAIKHKIDGIICPNEMVGKSFGISYCVVPDYIYTPKGTKKAISFYDKKYDICIVGRLNADKGVAEAALRLKNSKFRVLIAGQAPKEYEVLLKGICMDAENIDLQLEYLSDEMYKQYINNSKYCFLNYQNEYSNRSSGVVFDILFSGVPVIGNQCKALNFIKDYNMGYIYNDIMNFDLERLFDVNTYCNYLNNIERYISKHQEYHNKLSNYLDIMNV